MATVQIPIQLTVPSSEGNGYPALTTANGFTNVRQIVPAFVKDVDGDWWGKCRTPQDYVSTPKVVLSLCANAITGVTRMSVATSPMADAEQLDTAVTAETAQDVTVPATAKVRKDVTFTLTPVVAAGDELLIRIRHEGTHVNDTLAVDTLMPEVVFQYANA